MSDLRERIKQELPKPDAGAGFSLKEPDHPAGPVKHPPLVQALLIAGFVGFFLLTCISIHITQLFGLPLYVINKDWFYAYQAFAKQNFGLATNFVTQYFSPTTVRVSGDESMKGQLKETRNGLLEVNFPERLVMMANHQIYTDWLFLWWICYTGRMHGHIFIILKESLKYIPLIGPGMMFYRFIFVARSWQKDQSRLQYRLRQLSTQHQPSSKEGRLDPMWLLIFPEGTNLSQNGRDASRKWADKTGLQDMQHQLLPRSTGLQFCLKELQNTVEWVYDCTIAYQGVPRGEFGQDIFTLRSTYFQGRYPKSINMYWRRFNVKSIPIEDSKAFEVWLRERWTEKDKFLEQYQQTGRFPDEEDDSSGGAGKTGHIETLVKSRHTFEFLLIFAPLIPIGLCVYGVLELIKRLRTFS